MSPMLIDHKSRLADIETLLRPIMQQSGRGMTLGELCLKLPQYTKANILQVLAALKRNGHAMSKIGVTNEKLWILSRGQYGSGA